MDAVARVAVAERLGVVFLDRHLAAEAGVVGLVGDAEPAPAQDGPDAIGAVEEVPTGRITRLSKAASANAPV
jgi:hypothetical protein